MKVYVLTIGKDLYYATEDYNDAEYEKKATEEENWQGRKQNIKLTEVEIDLDHTNGSVTLANDCTYNVESILSLL